MQEFPRDDSGKDEGDYILEEKKSKLIADLKIALGKAEASEEKKAANRVADGIAEDILRRAEELKKALRNF